MRRLTFLAMLAFVPAAAIAGDTPVIYTVTGIPTTGPGKGVEVLFDHTATGVTVRNLSGATAAAGTVRQPVETPVGPVSMSRGETDILYTRLMQEARKRGLR